jgi:hypothetical protein
VGAQRVSIDFTEGRLPNKNDSRNPWTNKAMLQEFVDLNNRVDSSTPRRSPYEKLLSKMFQLNVGYFLIQCASEEDKENVYRLCGQYSREDANGVPQI